MRIEKSSDYWNILDFRFVLVTQSGPNHALWELLSGNHLKPSKGSKGPFVNYVIMFLPIFDQVSTLVTIGYHFPYQP